jgi:AcrR family transcriptional regulator
VQKTTLKRKATRNGAKLRRLHRSAIPPEQIDSPQRRRDILRAAAELFAVHGYNGVSLRDIAGRANVPVALCTYYFGRKSELFASVFLHSSDHIEKRRAALQAFPDSGSLEQLMHLWIDPLMRMRSNSEEAPFAMLSARASWDSSDEATAAVKRFYDPIAFAVLNALKKLYPERDQADLTWGYGWALGAVLMHLANNRIERISRGSVKAGDAGKTDMLICFLCAGLRAILAQPNVITTNR